jgi:hypothetical protein
MSIRHLPLQIANKMYAMMQPDQSAFGRNWKMFPAKEYSSRLIINALESPQPVMIARLGSTELQCMVNYIGVQRSETLKNIKGYVTDKTPQWWWNQKLIQQMEVFSGFFPTELKKIEQFCELMINILPDVDILGSWLKEESFFANDLSAAKKVMLEDLEPFFSENPWTKALKGRKVLVVHPFADTIRSQYSRREKLFDDDLLPEFQLDTVQAVQSIAGQPTGFKDWFEALESMKEEISRRDFDVCILGCGAYGFPLASHVKAMGRKAIHLGGVTQLLFGIKGKRWEEYIVYPYANLFNEHWVRPGQQEIPKKHTAVEGGCYW